MHLGSRRIWLTSCARSFCKNTNNGFAVCRLFHPEHMLSVEVVDTELFFDILMAALAAFGLWCLIRLSVEWIAYSGAVGVMVRVLDKETESQLDDLLWQARGQLGWRRRAGIDVLYSRSLCQDGHIPPCVLATARRFGARCWLVDADANKK